jgi:hypothetical protein
VENVLDILRNGIDSALPRSIGWRPARTDVTFRKRQHQSSKYSRRCPLFRLPHAGLRLISVTHHF